MVTSLYGTFSKFSLLPYLFQLEVLSMFDSLLQKGLCSAEPRLVDTYTPSLFDIKLESLRRHLIEKLLV